MDDKSKRIDELRSTLQTMKTEVFSSGQPIVGERYNEYKKLQTELLKLESEQRQAEFIVSHR